MSHSTTTLTPRWDIQEINTTAAGPVWGRVLYGRPINISRDGLAPPSTGWEHAGDRAPGVWHGSAPSPVVVINEYTASISDCDSDECLEWFFNRAILTLDDNAVMADNRGPLSPVTSDMHYPKRFWLPCALVDATEECVCEDVTSAFRQPTEQEIQQYHADFVREGVVGITNVLMPHVLNRFVEELKKYKHSNFWHASFWDEDSKSAKMVARTPANEASIARILAEQHLARSRKEYAYSFTRTNDYMAKKFVMRIHSLFFEHTVDLMQSTYIKGLLKRITGNDYDLAVNFYSRYTSGDL